MDARKKLMAHSKNGKLVDGGWKKIVDGGWWMVEKE